ncbi:hypothetical protein CYMTET_24291 [Cymbomonas tetramitiformis]|uniref:Cyclin C-terminal domain-containing protein n=1 Tax=Cymbomonas tetramitiformis TaxID=36881 RepID=A0AAE0FWN0_9CHLO|nr:hypothetical protein CYMTET_24291 [Cymbomonas tetramitiformis]
MKSGRNGRRMHAAALRDISNAKVEMDAAMGTDKSLKRGAQTLQSIDNYAVKRRSIESLKSQGISVNVSREVLPLNVVDGTASAGGGPIELMAAATREDVTTRTEGDENVAPPQVQPVASSETTASARPLPSADEVRCRLFSMFDDEEAEEGEALDLLCTEVADGVIGVCNYEDSDIERETRTGPSEAHLTSYENEQLFPFSEDGGYRRSENSNRCPEYLIDEPGNSRYVRRTQLVNWLLCLKNKLKLDSQTFHLSVYFVDAFLAQEGGVTNFLDRGDECAAHWEYAAKHQGAVLPDSQDSIETVPHHRLRRLGVTCLFLASKLVEVEIPSARKLATASDAHNFTRRELVLGEKIVLKRLSFNLRYTTALSFARAFSHVLGSRPLSQMVNYLVDLAIHSHYALRYTPSKIAAAAVIIAVEVMPKAVKFKSCHLRALEGISGYTEEELLAPCAMLKVAVNTIRQHNLLCSRKCTKIPRNNFCSNFFIPNSRTLKAPRNVEGCCV